MYLSWAEARKVNQLSVRLCEQIFDISYVVWMQVDKSLSEGSPPWNTGDTRINLSNSHYINLNS